MQNRELRANAKDTTPNSFEHHGYLCKVEYDDSIETFHGRILTTREVVTFEGASVGFLKKAFRESAGDHLKKCAEGDYHEFSLVTQIRYQKTGLDKRGRFDDFEFGLGFPIGLTDDTSDWGVMLQGYLGFELRHSNR